MLRAAWLHLLRVSLHVRDTELLAYLDGELGRRRARRVRLHLLSCSDCSARLRQMEKSLTWFGDLNAKASDAPPPPRNWQDFEGKLAALAASRQQPGHSIHPWNRWARPLQRAALALAGALVCFAAVRLWTARSHGPAPPAAVTPAGERKTPMQPSPLSGGNQVASVAKPSTPLQPETRDRLRAPEGEVAAKAIDIEYALHRIRACIGGEVQVVRGAHSSLQVEGTVASADRRTQILAALAGVRIPAWVSIRIRPVPQGGAAPTTKAPTAAVEQRELTAGRSRIEDRVQHYLRDHPEAARKGGDPVAELSGRILSDVSASVREGWALKRLVEQYRDEGLDADRLHTLAVMLRDHITAMDEQQRAAAALLGPILGTAPSPAAPETEPQTWRAASARAFDQDVEFEHYVSILFGGDTGDVNGDEAVRRLAVLTPRLEASLKSAERQLASTYLTLKY